MNAFLSIAIAAWAALQDLDTSVLDLAADDVRIRNRAGAALVRLWERDDVKKRMEDLAKGSGDTDLQRSARSILGWMELRRTLGKPLVEAIGNVEGLFEAGDHLLPAAFQSWFKDLKRVGLDDPERRRAVLESVLSRLTTAESKSGVLQIVENRVFDVENRTLDDHDPALWVVGVAPLLKDESAQVRADAMCLLGRAGLNRFEGGIEDLLSDVAEVCSPFFANCEKGPACRNCGRVPVAAVAADALAALGAKGAAKKIAELLKQRHVRARGHAAKALGRLGAAEFAGEIAGLLEEVDAGNQVAAMEALTQLGAKAFSKRIGRLLASKEAWVRFHALRALADLDAQDQVDGIRAILKDDNVDFRGEAAHALARLGRKECAGEIAALLAEDSPSLAPHDQFWVTRVVLALKSLEAKESARALKRAAVQRSPRLGVFTIDGGPPEFRPRKLTLAELVDETLRGWGIDPESLKD